MEIGKQRDAAGNAFLPRRHVVSRAPQIVAAAAAAPLTFRAPTNHRGLRHRISFPRYLSSSINTTTMAPASLLDLIEALPSQDGWGPQVTEKDTLNGIPYAPFSKGDKLGRMADWTEGKDRDRGGRQQYGRGYRGTRFPL
jgi:hypothetical protein